MTKLENELKEYIQQLWDAADYEEECVVGKLRIIIRRDKIEGCPESIMKGNEHDLAQAEARVVKMCDIARDLEKLIKKVGES